MSNQNKNVVENKQEVEQQQPVQNAPAAEPAPVQQNNVAPEQKTTFGGWLKQHWKGVTAAILGVGATAGTAIAAYKKGKAAGTATACAPVEQQEDYSLNPNE